VLELLGCTGLDDSCLFALARGCPRLSHLSLDGLSWVAELALCVSLLMLHELHSVSLVEADLFTTSGLRSLLTGSSTLQHVHLPSPALMWHVIFKQMEPAQLDAWGAGRILRVWHGHIPPCCMFSVCLLHCSPDRPPQCAVAHQLPGMGICSLFWCYALHYYVRCPVH
jgi:hypothetical protein